MKKVSTRSFAIGFFLVASFCLPRIAEARTTDELATALCSKMKVCSESDAKLRKQVGKKTEACFNKLTATPGTVLWSDFGLVGFENQLRAPDVEGMITNGEVLISKNNLAKCIQEINALQCGVISENVTKGFMNTEYALSTKGACPNVYSHVVSVTTTSGQLIDSICTTYAGCQKEAAGGTDLAKETCVEALNGPAGKVMWGSFGPKKFKNQFTAAEIERQISSKEVNVNVEALNECKMHEIPTIDCEDFNANLTASNWDNIDKVLGRSSPCKNTLTSSRGKH